MTRRIRTTKKGIIVTNEPEPAASEEIVVEEEKHPVYPDVKVTPYQPKVTPKLTYKRPVGQQDNKPYQPKSTPRPTYKPDNS